MSTPRLPQSDSVSKSPKLTAKQRAALELAAGRGVWNKHRDNKFHSAQAPLQILHRLEAMGLIEPIKTGDSCWAVQYIATDAGLAMLESEAAQ